MIDSATTLDRLAARSAQLYSLPGVAMQVLQLTRNPHVDTRSERVHRKRPSYRQPDPPRSQ